MASTHGSASIALMWCIRRWIQLIVAGPWLLAGGVVFLAMRSLIRLGRRRTER